MPTFRSALIALAVAGLGVCAAAAAAWVMDAVAIGPDALVPAAAALVVATVFWRRPPEGLLNFGIFALLADTLAHWLGVDLLLFDEIGLLLLGAVALAAGHADVGRLRLGWLEVAIGVLALAAVLSSLVNAVPVLTWMGGLYLLLKGIVFFLLVRLLRLTAADAERMGIAMLVVSAVIGLMGLVELLDPSAFQRALGLPVYEIARAEVPVIKSIFLHPALYGWLTAYASLLCYARFMTHRSWWALPSGVAFNVGTFLSGRRTPLIGVGLAVAVGLLWSSTRLGLRGSLLRIWAPVAGLAIIGLILVAPSMGRLVELTIVEYGPSLAPAREIFADEPRSDVIADVHPRIALYTASAAIARDEFPLGGGIGRFGSHLSRAEYSPLYERYGLDQIRLLRPDDPQAATDAFWPMILGETGVVGLLSALVIFIGMAAVLWRAASDARTAGLRTIALAALFVVVEGVIRSATSSVYVAPPIAYFVLGTAGVALAAAATDEPPDGPATG